MANMLYNGLSLPDSSGLTTTKKPYRAIILDNGDYRLYVTGNQYYWYPENYAHSGEEGFFGANGVSEYIVSDGEWVYNSAWTGGWLWESYGKTIVWADYDILNKKTSEVYLAGSEPNDPNYVTGISVYAPDSVTRGFFVDITADVSGEGDYDTSATCTMSGANAENTILDKMTDKIYRLYCSSQETAESITVNVASVQDQGIQASKAITVKAQDDNTQLETEAVKLKKAYLRGFISAVVMYQHET